MRRPARSAAPPAALAAPRRCARRRRRAPAALLAAALTLVAAVPAGAACPTTATFDPAVPSWQAVNGFALGDRPATVAELDRYLLAVDAASDRVVTGTLGTSVQGRPIRYAMVSEPGALARRDAIAATMRDLRRGVASPEAAQRTAASEPAFAWIAGNVHGNEPSGADAAVRLLHDLAARVDCANLERLDRLITVVVPTQNPDGRARGTRTNAAGFDLNRDWFARTQPETAGKVELLARMPPVLFVDSHEEASSRFFFPPYTDPVYAEVPGRALDAMNSVFSPALRAAFDARAIPYRTSASYDFFFPGYGDSSTTIAFGAAGMTFEKGADAAFADRVDEQYLAQATALDAAAKGKPALLQGWAAGWREARAEGAAGRLSPNRSLQPGATPRVAVPTAPVHAYALRADRAPSEVARLIERLQGFGVEVLRLRSAARVEAFDPYGPAGAQAALLPAGTFWVPLAQGPKHWVQTLLNEQTYVPFASFSDVSAWSNPLLMGVQGGAVGDAAAPAGLDAVTAPPRLGKAPKRRAAAYAVRTDGTGALALLSDLLRRGTPVRRAERSFTDRGTRFAAGTAVLGAGTSGRLLRRLAVARQTPVVSLRRVPARTRALKRTTVGVLGDLEPTSGASSAGWERWVLGQRLGLAVRPLGAGLPAGDLERVRALVVPDGALDPGALGASTLARLAAWVRAGGTFIGIRTRGIEVARAAGLTAETSSAPTGLRSPGALVGVQRTGRGPLTWGLEGTIAVPDDDDPVMEGPAPAALRVPRRGAFVSGYIEGADLLRGAPLATDEPRGAGHVILLSFDPGFRGYAEAAQRVLGNAVLRPRTKGAAAGAATLPVRPSELGALPPTDAPRRP